MARFDGLWLCGWIDDRLLGIWKADTAFWTVFSHSPLVIEKPEQNRIRM